jgi:hypothetical protein
MAVALLWRIGTRRRVTAALRGIATRGWIALLRIGLRGIATRGWVALLRWIATLWRITARRRI